MVSHGTAERLVSHNRDMDSCKLFPQVPLSHVLKTRVDDPVSKGRSQPEIAADIRLLNWYHFNTGFLSMTHMNSCKRILMVRSHPLSFLAF